MTSLSEVLGKRKTQSLIDERDDNGMSNYHTTPADLKTTLAKYGVAIIPNVLDENECKHMINGMWNYLETTTARLKPPISKYDSKSWRQIKELYPLHWMLIKQFGIGHTQMSWDLRQNPKIVAPFAALWDTEDLVCSFDGASFQMPPEVVGAGWDTGRRWWHTDQSLTRNGFECVQAWVTAYDTNVGDGTLAVLEGSHLLHAEFGKQFKITDKPDWYKLKPEHVEWYTKKGCQPISIQCPAGSMVFWDSRTIHCGVNARKGRPHPNTLRCIAYLCMTPRALCSATTLQKRIQAFETLRTTSHWPHKFKMNSTAPRTYGLPIQPICPISKPTLTALGRRLVGYVK